MTIRRWVLTALLLLGSGGVLLAAPAGAQGSPPTSQPCIPAGSFPGLDPLAVCPPRQLVPAVSEAASSPTTEADAPPSGMLGGITGEQVGRFPDDHYDLGYDEGSWNNFGAKLRGSFADLFFGISRFAASVGNWFIDFAYDLGFVKLLAPVAAKLAAGYNSAVIGGIHLRHVALTVAVVYAGWVALRGRVGHGLGELGVSMVLAVLGAMFVANPGGYLTGAFEMVGRFTQTVLMVGTEEGQGQDVQSVVRPLRQSLQETLIAQPYDVLNWGALLDGGPCAGIRDEILATGPHGTSDEPRQKMGSRPECERHAEWNHDATWERVGGAFLVMLGTFLVVGLLVAVAGTVLLAQFTAAGIVAVSPFAAVALILPAGARGLGWRLVTGFLGAMVAVITMSLLLAVGLRGLVAMLGATESGLLPRFTLFLVMAMALVMARKKFAEAGRSMASKAGERLTSVRVAGAGGGAWAVPAASGTPWALPAGAYLTEKARHTGSAAVAWRRQRNQSAAAGTTETPLDDSSEGDRRPSTGRKVEFDKHKQPGPTAAVAAEGAPGRGLDAVRERGRVATRQPGAPAPATPARTWAPARRGSPRPPSGFSGDGPATPFPKRPPRP